VAVYFLRRFPSDCSAPGLPGVLIQWRSDFPHFGHFSALRAIVFSTHVFELPCPTFSLFSAPLMSWFFLCLARYCSKPEAPTPIQATLDAIREIELETTDENTQFRINRYKLLCRQPIPVAMIQRSKSIAKRLSGHCRCEYYRQHKQDR